MYRRTADNTRSAITTISFNLNKRPEAVAGEILAKLKEAGGSILALQEAENGTHYRGVSAAMFYFATVLLGHALRSQMTTRQT